MKLDTTGKSYVDMLFNSSLERHTTLPSIIAGNRVKLIEHIWTNCSATVHSGDHHITFAFKPSCIEQKLTREKFRDHSESCLKL